MKSVDAARCPISSLTCLLCLLLTLPMLDIQSSSPAAVYEHGLLGLEKKKKAQQECKQCFYFCRPSIMHALHLDLRARGPLMVHERFWLTDDSSRLAVEES